PVRSAPTITGTVPSMKPVARTAAVYRPSSVLTGRAGRGGAAMTRPASSAAASTRASGALAGQPLRLAVRVATAGATGTSRMTAAHRARVSAPATYRATPVSVSPT